MACVTHRRSSTNCHSRHCAAIGICHSTGSSFLAKAPCVALSCTPGSLRVAIKGSSQGRFYGSRPRRPSRAKTHSLNSRTHPRCLRATTQAVRTTPRQDLGLAPSLTQLVTPYYKHFGARNIRSISQTGYRAPIAQTSINLVSLCITIQDWVHAVQIY